MRVRESRAASRCAFCHGTVGAESVLCSGCGTRIHAECTADLRACPTLGCRERVSARVEPFEPFWETVVRVSLALLALFAAASCVARASEPGCGDPGCMREVTGAIVPLAFFGSIGAALIGPVIRGSLRERRWARAHALLWLVGMTFAALPLMTLVNPFDEIQRFELGWVTCEVSYRQLLDGPEIVTATAISLHSVLAITTLAHVLHAVRSLIGRAVVKV